jgi:hypothetical protein
MHYTKLMIDPSMIVVDRFYYTPEQISTRHETSEFNEQIKK